MKNILLQLENEIQNRAITDEEIASILSSYAPARSRRIIGGYSSVAVVDREGHRITIPALKNAVAKFMSEDRYRPIMVFHSDIQIGRILPKWTNPDTGETLTTHIDDKGWYTVCEIRDDIEIANKVWDEILSGRIRSFSIAGSSKDKSPSWEGGIQHTAINDLEIYESTLCLKEGTKVWTVEGLKNIENIQKDDEVITHKINWKKVTKTFKRYIDEEIIKITTDMGDLFVTNEHPIRSLKYGGKNLGTKYIWQRAANLKEGDFISSHYPIGYCKKCNKPIFIEKEGIQEKFRKYCSYDCRYSSPGNRLGSHYVSKLKGITKRDNPNLSGGFKTKEGKLKQRLAHQTPEFCAKRKEIQTQLWQDSTYRENQSRKIHARRKELGTYKKHSQYMKNLWSDTKYVKKMLSIWKKRPNKLEELLEAYLQDNFPNEWKYVGCGDFLIESKNPDFININGKKKIIELNGEYWHKNEKDTRDRINLFNSYGYETLIITDIELKKEPLECLNKISEFANNKLSKVIKVEKVQYRGFVYNLEVEDDNSYVTEFAVVHNCEEPVNQLSKFDVLWNPQKVTI